MKKLYLYIVAAAAALFTLAACVNEEPYVMTVDVADTFAYIDNNFDEAQIVHRTVLSASSFKSVFPIKVNKGVHQEVRASLVYDKAAAEAYNTKNGTSYPILDESYIAMSKYGNENAALEWTVPAEERISVDSVLVTLKGDLSALQESNYIAAFKLQASGEAVSEDYGTYILKVSTMHSLIRKITALTDLVGSTVPDSERSTWTADISKYAALFTGNGVYSSRNSYPSLTANKAQTITVDLQKEHLITGLKFYSRNYSRVKATNFFYSTNGTDFTSFGDTSNGGILSVREGSAYVQAVGLYDYVSARYVRFNITTTSSSYPFTGFNITEATSSEAELFLVGSNSASGKIVHNLATNRHSSDFSAQFSAMASLSSTGGYSVSAEYDASLVESFNAAKGTSYTALPAGNLEISGAPAKIAAGEMASGAITASLTGDLSQLTAESGYLAPIALKSNGLKSASNSVIYLILNQSYVYLLSGFSGAPGTEVLDKSGWSVTSDIPSHSVYGSKNIKSIIDNVIDRNLDNSWYQFYKNGASRTNITVNFGTTLNVSGVRINPTDLPCMDYDLAFSTDGVNFTEMGTASMSDGTMLNLNSDGVCALYKTVPMTHLRVTMHSGYFGMHELGVFTK